MLAGAPARQAHGLECAGRFSPNVRSGASNALRLRRLGLARGLRRLERPVLSACGTDMVVAPCSSPMLLALHHRQPWQARQWCQHRCRRAHAPELRRLGAGPPPGAPLDEPGEGTAMATTDGRAAAAAAVPYANGSHANGAASTSTDVSSSSAANAPPRNQAHEASSSHSAHGAAAEVGAVVGAPAPRRGGIAHRWKVVLMMMAAFVLCNMDKVNMSVAVIPMAKDLGWSATDRGLVSSSFFWGYSLTQVPAGWISTRVGGAKVLMAGVALWSFGTLIAPPAAQLGLWALCATRMLVGLGEGFAPSAATSVLARLVPATERSRAVTTVWGGLDIGSAVGLLLSGPLIRMYGWPSVFYLFAVIGGVWCLLWPLLQPEKDDENMVIMQDGSQASGAPAPSAPRAAVLRVRAHPGSDGNSMMSADEAILDARIAAGSMDEEDGGMPSAPASQAKRGPGQGTTARPPPPTVPWGEFMRSPPVWAVTIAHFCFNWGYYTLLAWLPSYFELALGLNVQSSSFLTLIPYVAMTLMTPVVGPIADGMVRAGRSLTFVRKFCQGMAFLGPAACMVACGMLTPATPGANANTTLLVALLSLGFALGAWSRGGLYCNHQDLSPKYASALLGITNTAGAIPGVLGVTSAGYLLDATGSWSYALFLPTAACQIFGAIMYTIFASSERQHWS